MKEENIRYYVKIKKINHSTFDIDFEEEFEVNKEVFISIKNSCQIGG